MLKKAFRIPTRESFAKAHVFHTPFFVLKAKKNSLEYSRFGVVISKKVEKRAVVRNRMRRLIVSVIEEHKLYEKKGYDMLFILRNSFSDDRDLIEQMILQTHTRVHTL